MMAKQKSAVMIYPYFSLQEITCLTSCLALWEEREIDVFASSREIMKSEDGFQVIANKTFDEFAVDEYDSLILPGIINPLPALFDEKNIAFLRGLAGQDIVIASISSSPLLLARAGLLKNRQFTCGVWEEVIDFYDFVPKENVMRVPVHKDGNIITAIGFAFREFAVEVLHAVGVECSDNILQGVNRAFSEEELYHSMGEENFKEFLAEHHRHAPKQ